MLTERYTDQVKIIKLINGEEIIAYTSKTEDNSIVIKRPLMAVLGVNPQNPAQAQVSFCPWLSCGNSYGEFTLGEDKILIVAPAEANATNQYVASVGDIRG